MIEVRELTRRYADFTAVSDVSFAVDDGEIVGILGPNGAGKTTTIRMVTGFLPPTSGHITVAGHDLVAEPVRTRAEIGYLPETVSLYPEMRVSEYLGYRARLEGMDGTAARKAIPEVAERCLIDDVADRIIGTLSKGYRQRVGIATAILHDPKVLVLDEPTVGLDPKQIIAIRQLIRNLGSKHTILLSTHILPEVELLCDRVLIIDQGRIIAEGTPQSLQQQWVGNTVLRVEVKDAPSGAPDVFGAIPGVGAVGTTGEGRWQLDCEADQDLREPIFRAAVENGWTLLELVQETASLEDVFVRLTTHEQGRDQAPAAESPGVEEVAS